jgi:hypothetical protein
MRPLVFHLADGQMEASFLAFFGQSGYAHKLGCARFDFDPEEDILRVPEHKDPQVFGWAHENLRPFLRSHERAVVVLDRQFPGTPPGGAEEIRQTIKRRLVRAGWREDHCEIVVIQPMLEAWLWTDSPHVEAALGHRRPPTLRSKMQQQGLWPEGLDKPPDLKHATATAAAWGGIVCDAALFTTVFASPRSLSGCKEPGFLLLRDTLRRWFPPEGANA